MSVHARYESAEALVSDLNAQVGLAPGGGWLVLERERFLFPWEREAGGASGHSVYLWEKPIVTLLCGDRGAPWSTYLRPCRVVCFNGKHPQAAFGPASLRSSLAFQWGHEWSTLLAHLNGIAELSSGAPAVPGKGTRRRRWRCSFGASSLFRVNLPCCSVAGSGGKWQTVTDHGSYIAGCSGRCVQCGAEWYHDDGHGVFILEREGWAA